MTGKNQEDPNVEIFGNDFKEKDMDKCCSGRRSGGGFWGILLLLVGVTLLLNNFKVIPWLVWDYLWQFWPVIFILWGIQIILGNNFLSKMIIFLLSIVLFGFIFLNGLYQINSPLLFYIPKEIINFLTIINWQRMI
jgi:hypothetical protein